MRKHKKTTLAIFSVEYGWQIQLVLKMPFTNLWKLSCKKNFYALPQQANI